MKVKILDVPQFERIYEDGGTNPFENVVRNHSPEEKFFNTLQSDLEQLKKKQEIIHINDPRTIRMTSGKKINPNVDLKTGDYNTSYIINIIKEAKKRNVDPATLIAIDLGETTLGKTDKNIGHTLYTAKNTTESPMEPGYNLANMIEMFKQKTEEAKKLGYSDEAHQIQAYNGLGNLYPDTESEYYKYHKNNQFYGVPVTKEGLSMKKNPLYGKEIINLRDSVIKQNPGIMKLISETRKNGGEIYRNAGEIKPKNIPTQFDNTQNPLDVNHKINVKSNYDEMQQIRNTPTISAQKVPGRLEWLEKHAPNTNFVNDVSDYMQKKTVENLTSDGRYEKPGDWMERNNYTSPTAQTAANIMIDPLNLLAPISIAKKINLSKNASVPFNMWEYYNKAYKNFISPLNKIDNVQEVANGNQQKNGGRIYKNGGDMPASTIEDLIKQGYKKGGVVDIDEKEINRLKKLGYEFNTL
jgi:hypothetical protein